MIWYGLSGGISCIIVIFFHITFIYHSVYFINICFRKITYKLGHSVVFNFRHKKYNKYNTYHYSRIQTLPNFLFYVYLSYIILLHLDI